MSRIDELIRELCPEGVGNVPLGTFIEEVKARAGLNTALPVYGISNSLGLLPSGEIFNTSRASSDRSGYKVVQPSDVAYNPSRINVGSIAMSRETMPVIVSPMYVVFSIKDGLDPEFLEHFMRSTVFKSQVLANIEVGARFRFTFEAMANVRVPAPPIGVQREIVSILDKFTQLEAELEAELEARRVQYEETRNSLLNFDQDLSSHPLSKMIREMCPDGVASATIESLCTTYRPKTTVPRAKYLVHGSLPIVDQSQNFIAGYTEDLQSKVSVGPCVVFGDHTRERKFVDFDFAAGADGTVILIPANLMDPKFFFFSLASLAIPSRGYNRHWTIAREMKVALPPLGIQREIVSILDKMDALVNDISFGLPAEIAARRKQYEYYRNKLLTFKELDAA